MAEVNSMVRIGIVSALDKKSKTARAYYPDMGNMVSGWLYVLQRPGEAISTDTAGPHSHGGEVSSGGSHSHSGTVGTFMPKVNDRVLVLYPFGWNMDGYILGVIP